MSNDEPIQVDTKADTPASPTAPSGNGQPSTTERRRPRLDLNAALGGDRKRKGILGLVVGTLNKAKIEDKERSASEAAKKRQLIEKRLQQKLRKETDSVRRAEEAKKDKTLANRKEEDLQLKDSIYKLRRKRLPILANFLLTSDVIPSDSSSSPHSTNPLSAPPRSHPPPLYYLPAILTPAQEAFISRRKAEVNEAAEKEWETFKQEREAGIEEIKQLRQKVADEEARQKLERDRDAMDTDGPQEDAAAPAEEDRGKSQLPAMKKEQDRPGTDMEVDDGAPKPSEPAKSNPEPTEKKEDIVPMQADDDDAVEY
ncbi:hypothetical protein CC1G_04602 [Coprinopsis cinerea okayama7|uniref:Pinin/SDK/MemA protein domain-containing protein n=1 Tax=Coprinopsis cinerea (strain Okayama-7 / 130 / ATCC MYA-4618 / FGSC 9003) TaxID=240176 RepID=A8N524_COPC7|nr:hypothetical protein CC1G_04602 [Coprinopsis cinerea okayama7\|eukprot:XP_001829913.1 hypothetical protein CC1G_04602 [Coprinopsis cinerea okayama7\